MTTTETPRFSVVVPAHNEARFLGQTLASLRAQDFPGDVEIIVVDNASTDGTAAIALAGGARVVVEQRPGVCAARQRGTEAALGEIVVSTDADTTHPVDWLRRIDAAFRRPRRTRPETVAVAGPCRYVDPPWWAAVVPPLFFAAIGALSRTCGVPGYLTATNVAFRRVGFPGYDVDLGFGGDEVDLLRRLRRWGAVVWDPGNVVATSSRRLDQGLAHTLLVSFGYYYALPQLLRPVRRRPSATAAPPVRDERAAARLRRRWRLALLVGACVVVAVRRVRRRQNG